MAAAMSFSVVASICLYIKRGRWLLLRFSCGVQRWGFCRGVQRWGFCRGVTAWVADEDAFAAAVGLVLVKKKKGRKV